MAAMAAKEWIQVKRDTRSLILALIAPSLLVVLFGYALNVDVRGVRFGVLDHDRSRFSREYIGSLSRTEYLAMAGTIEHRKEIDRLLDGGNIIMAVVIPAGFQKNLLRGKPADVQLLVDGSDSTSAMIATGYARAMTYEFNAVMRRRDLARSGIAGVTEPVILQNRVWYNPELKSKNYIVPGLVVLILAIISALITSLTISREWERGTMETLIATPVRAHEVVIGKMVPYLVIGVFDVIAGITIGYFIFDVPFRGGFVELLLVSFLFLVGTSSMGIAISSATRVQVLSVQFAIVATYLPSFILSDFIFPISDMPVVVQAVTYVVPAKYLITLLKGMALKGVGATVLWAQIVFLAIFSAVMTGLAIKQFRPTLPEK
jgi:ABC-2 type transport system permease protein